MLEALPLSAPPPPTHRQVSCLSVSVISEFQPSLNWRIKMHSIQIVECIASFAFDCCTCLIVISSFPSRLNLSPTVLGPPLFPPTTLCLAISAQAPPVLGSQTIEDGSVSV